MSDVVDRLRALALPEAAERASHGSSSFFCGTNGKQFVSVDDHHHGADHVGFWCPAPPGVQPELIAEDGARFFRPPYVGHRGWVGVRLEAAGLGPPRWDEIAELVLDAYRQVAPKRLLAQLDCQDGRGG